MGSTRYHINWSVLDRKMGKIGMTPKSLSKAIGRSDSFYSSMKAHNSQMLYKDALRIAKVLNIRGVTKFATNQTNLDASKKSNISEIKTPNQSEEEAKVMMRIADALERIASALEGRSEPWQLSL